MRDPFRYPIPARIHRVEETIQRSKFVTTAAHAPVAEAAHAFVAAIREEYPDATHNCWAFVAGAPGSTTHIGMSDDGEPHGTAGRPMLTALLHGGVGEIVAVSTRYFGGVKLGTGGLARAYASGVKLVLATLPVEEKIERAPLEIAIGYADVDALQRLIQQCDVIVENETYEADVRYRCLVPRGVMTSFRDAVADASRGSAVISES